MKPAPVPVESSKWSLLGRPAHTTRVRPAAAPTSTNRNPFAAAGAGGGDALGPELACLWKQEATNTSARTKAIARRVDFLTSVAGSSTFLYRVWGGAYHTALPGLEGVARMRKSSVLFVTLAIISLLLLARAASDEVLQIIPGTNRGRPPDPQTAASIAKVDPAHDDWDSEVFSESAISRLDQLAKVIESAKLKDTTALAGFTTPDFTSGPLRPPGLVEIYKDDTMQVMRAASGAAVKGSGQAGASGLAAALADLIAPYAEIAAIRVSFELIRADLTPGAAVTSAWFSATGRGAKGSVEQTALWRMTWSRPATGPPLLQSIQAEQYEEVKGAALPGALFADATEAVLGANKSFRGMLLDGVDHWLERMESWIESDSFGHNGIAIGDVNGDGLDDLYLCQMAGLPNLLFVQNPDGTAKIGNASCKD